MRILVVGATGLIGSAVSARAIAQGHRVIAAIRPGPTTRPAGIEGAVEVDVARAIPVCTFMPSRSGEEGAAGGGSGP
jgi:uncharacterized protein YbjT (DUF2867 family)